MQRVLGIDLSTQPCEVTLCQVEGDFVEIISRSSVLLPAFADRQILRSPEAVSVLRRKNRSADAPHSQDSAEGMDEGDAQAEVILDTVHALRQALEQIEPSWTSSSVILPQHDYLSLNLDLPFSDPKNLDRIVDLEVQDVVPFELDDFFIQYSPLGPINTKSNAAQAMATAPQYDVHIGIVPRVVVRNMLEICKAAGLEPNILTVPSSAIGAVYQLAKDRFVPNSAVILNRGDEYAIAISVAGEVRVERSIFASQLVRASSAPKRDEQIQQIFTAIKLVLASAERRYQTRIEKVYLLGREVKAANSHQIFGRPLEGVSLQSVISGGEQSAGISPLSVIFAQDDAEKSPLSNLRTREFSFTPRIGEFVRALLGTRRHVLQTIGVVCIALLLVYGAREYAIGSARSTLVKEIKRVIPTFSDDTSAIRENLMKSESLLASELGAFSTRGRINPADAFLEVVKILPTDSNISVTTLRVTGTKVQITGYATMVAPVEQLVETLRKRKDLFSKVTMPSTSSSGQARYNFTIECDVSE